MSEYYPATWDPRNSSVTGFSRDTVTLVITDVTFNILYICLNVIIISNNSLNLASINITNNDLPYHLYSREGQVDPVQKNNKFSVHYTFIYRSMHVNVQTLPAVLKDQISLESQMSHFYLFFLFHPIKNNSFAKGDDKIFPCKMHFILQNT